MLHIRDLKADNPMSLQEHELMVIQENQFVSSIALKFCSYNSLLRQFISASVCSGFPTDTRT